MDACRRSESPGEQQQQQLDHQDAAAACAWILQVQRQSCGSHELAVLQPSPCRLRPAPDRLLMTTTTTMEQSQQQQQVARFNTPLALAAANILNTLKQGIYTDHDPVHAWLADPSIHLGGVRFNLDQVLQVQVIQCQSCIYPLS